MDLNREEVIWASGLFEGEGTIGLSRLPSGRRYPRIKLKMCDRDSVDRFATVFGLKVQEVKQDKSWKAHYKDAFYTDCCGERAVAILYMMFPWLGNRRQERAKEVIESWKITSTLPVKASNQYRKKTV